MTKSPHYHHSGWLVGEHRARHCQSVNQVIGRRGGSPRSVCKETL